VTPRVFVVQPIPEPALELMREVAEVEVYPYTDRMVSTDELAAAARRSDYIFTMHETMIPREVVEANPQLKGIAVGGDDYPYMIDVAACQEAGIPILLPSQEEFDTARADIAKATADLTVAMVLCLAYRVVEADNYTRAGGFRQEMTMDLMCVGCAGKTVGIIGMGWVARYAVPRFRSFEMDVLYTKRTRLSSAEEAELGVRWADLDPLLEQSDFVCMLADYNPSAHLLMGEREFKMMRPSAYFVNTGRGRTVDEGALIAALREGTIAGAGLDVFWNEPPVSHDPFVPREFRKLDNVVLAPHNGAATWESRTGQTVMAARTIVASINGTYSPPA
jgi:glyoxylate reductase